MDGTGADRFGTAPLIDGLHLHKQSEVLARLTKRIIASYI